MKKFFNEKTKNKIFTTAIKLFANKGYDGVGVREIAEKSKVNISMISYYFNGKIGILKEMVDLFHNKLHKTLLNIIVKEKSLNEIIEIFISELITFIRNNIELTIVIFNTVPLDIPEITESKVHHFKRLIKISNSIFTEYNLKLSTPYDLSIIGQSIITTLVSHFKFRKIQKRVWNINFNDKFYEKYIETTTKLFAEGLKGFIK